MPIRFTGKNGNGAGSGLTTIGVSANVPSIEIPAGTTLYYIFFNDGNNPAATVSIGYAPGGTEVTDNIELENGYASQTSVITFPVAKTLYITRGSAFTQVLFKVNF